ncbi:MAG: twin-arginine translocase TatA/TatE family subunit [Peptococcaceae bacterium]|nr:twin-arginine translocase TatA/TatE family subunit [Peptococcaceae bacterium]
MFPHIGVPELILILVVALIIFGPGKLPDVGKSLGKTIREFRKSSRDTVEDVTETISEVKEEVEDVKNTISSVTSGKGTKSAKSS